MLSEIVNHRYKVVVHTMGKQDYEQATCADTLEEAKEWVKNAKANREKILTEEPNSPMAEHVAPLDWEIIDLGE